RDRAHDVAILLALALRELRPRDERGVPLRVVVALAALPAAREPLLDPALVLELGEPLELARREGARLVDERPRHRPEPQPGQMHGEVVYRGAVVLPHRLGQLVPGGRPGMRRCIALVQRTSEHLTRGVAAQAESRTCEQRRRVAERLPVELPV